MSHEKFNISNSLLAACLVVTAVPSQANSIATAEASTGVRATLYQGNFALIDEARQVALSEGRQTVTWPSVSSSIVHDSVLLSGETRVTSRDYHYDVINFAALLKAHLNQTIEIVNTDPLSDTKVTLVAVQGGEMVVKTDEGLKVYDVADMLGKVRFPHWPDSLYAAPTLTFDVESEQAKPVPLRLTYLSNGFDWSTSYVADLLPQSSGSITEPAERQLSLSLSAWVNLNNRTDLALNDAQIQLMAGNVNRAPVARPLMKAQMEMMAADTASTGVAPESVGDYKLYTLPGPISLKARQDKQVALFDAPEVSVEKVLSASISLTESRPAHPFSVQLELKNEDHLGLGLPMPAGTIRFYQQDENSQRQFMGEASVPDMDRHDKQILTIGQAFGSRYSHSSTRYDIQREELEGTLTLTNSQPMAQVFRLTFNPVWTKPRQSQPVCAPSTSGGLEMLWRIETSDSVIWGPVRAASGNRCEVDVTVSGDSRADMHYRLNL